MKQILMVWIAALMTAILLSEDAAARDGFGARKRVVIYAEPRYPAEERGAIYGYAPGYYRPGRAGVLYGPYPLNPSAPISELRY